MTSNRGCIPWLQDPDVTLYHGDVLATLRELPAESVDCVVTSPPYWGLRDYGTGEWEGGDAGCDHQNDNYDRGAAQTGSETGGAWLKTAENRRTPMLATCGKCGATRIDQQLGLEPTPEQYVERMVEVFREVRRVLAAHGTVWLNLGDSYVSDPGKGGSGPGAKQGAHVEYGRERMAQVRDGKAVHGDVLRPFAVHGLRPKNLVGIPWRVAFALQADGWYLRSDIIWAKPNPMPESVTDRPTKAHEYVFLLSKQPRYFFDQEAVREPYQPSPEHAWRYQYGRYNAGGGKQRGEGDGAPDFLNQHDGYMPPARGPDGRRKTTVQAGDGSIQHRDGERWPNGGRNIRSVWEIATQPYPEAHFATFPEELARRCIAAGCPEQVCRVCGVPRTRLTSTEYVQHRKGGKWQERQQDERGSARSPAFSAKGTGRNEVSTLGFTDCGHSDYRPGIVLDPFMGSGTVAYVARKLGRHAVGIDLNESYLQLAARRLQQQSLFAEPAA